MNAYEAQQRAADAAAEQERVTAVAAAAAEQERVAAVAAEQERVAAAAAEQERVAAAAVQHLSPEPSPARGTQRGRKRYFTSVERAEHARKVVGLPARNGPRSPSPAAPAPASRVVPSKRERSLVMIENHQRSINNSSGSDCWLIAALHMLACMVLEIEGLAVVAGKEAPATALIDLLYSIFEDSNAELQNVGPFRKLVASARRKDGNRPQRKGPDLTWQKGFQDAAEAAHYMLSWFETSPLGGVVYDIPCCGDALTQQRNSVEWLMFDAPAELSPTVPHCYGYPSGCACGQGYQAILNPKGNFVVLRPCRNSPEAVQIPTVDVLRVRGKPFEVICAIEFLPAQRHYVTHLKNNGSWYTRGGKTNKKKNRFVSGHTFLLRAAGPGETIQHTIRSAAIAPSQVRRPFSFADQMDAIQVDDDDEPLEVSRRL